MGHEFMKKLICIMVLVCSCCFAGCSGSVSSIGEDFCDALFGGKYEEAASMMSGAMRSDMGEDEAASLLKSVEEQCGTYESARYVASETANDYTFVTVELQCAEGKLQAVVCLDDDRVAGMQLYSDSGETLEESDATADSATAAAFVNALFAEDYETAGSMMSDELALTMDQEACAALVEEAGAAYGSFSEVGAISVVGNIAYINVVFENKSVIFSANFDAEGNIDGFSSLGEG